jgi:hypothetical protein
MSIITKTQGWLTPGRRQAIQAAGVTIVTALQTVGVITDSQGQSVLNLTAGALSVLLAILALVHLSPDQQATWLSTSLRATVYGLAAVIGATAVAFGLTSQDHVAQILAVVSTVLTIIQALVAVVNAPTDTTQTVAAAVGEPTGIDQAGPIESVNEPVTASVPTPAA